MVGARTKRMERLTRVFPELAKLRGLEQDMNGNWLTLHASREASFEVPLPLSTCDAGMSEPDRILAESNYEVAMTRLEEVALFDDSVSYRTDHWVGPPIRTLVIRADDAAVVREAVDIIDSLEMYGVLDEFDLSEREADEKQLEWENCYSSDVSSIMVEKYDIPEDLMWSDGWEGFEQVDLDALVADCPEWREYTIHEALDMEAVAEWLASRVRETLCPADPEAGQSIARDCWCCSAPVIGPIWGLCDGCQGHERGGDWCDKANSWHCTGEFGHECDGTVCPEDEDEYAAELAEAAERDARYGGMDPEVMTPLF